MAKLTQDARTDIIRRVQAGETQQSLADEYGVAQSTIARILDNFRKRGNTLVEDPNPALSDEHAQARFWKRFERLFEVLSSRNSVLQIDINRLKDAINTSENRAKEAPTRALSDVHKARADTYRLELAALDDLTDLDDELTELLSDLYIRSQVLCRRRKVGLGRTVARDHRGDTL